MALFTAGGSGTQAYNVKIEAASGPDEWGSATFEIDGQPPPPGSDCFLTVPNPRRRYRVEVLAVAPSTTLARVLLMTRVKLIP